MNFKLLIVDDLPDNIKLLANVLSKEGFDIEFATSGFEALECLNAEKFDLILLDIMMPELNGFETCQRIKENPDLTDVPVIFLTAAVDVSSLQEGFQAGGVDYITKPFNAQELLARVNTHLELKSSKEKLKELNATLENKVKQRTNELATAHERLQLAHNELRILDDAKNNFLKIISHELRTPLNSILGFTELIREDPNGEDLPILINGLNRAAWRLEKLSYTALNITKLKVESSEIQLEKVSLKRTVQGALSDLENSMENVVCNFDFGGIDPSIQIYGDPTLLQQCFYNILENANHHSSECCVVTDYNSYGDVSCQISDNGDGFSDIALSNPFKLFAPGQNYINKHAGLGLNLSKLIMEAHNGRIEIGNVKDSGALVSLYFSKNNRVVMQ